jgi:protein-L-isoaspartate(D-aspartate) O-methyltransferase
MKAQVYSIERQKKLFDSNKEFSYLKKYPGLRMFYGDGFEGLPTFAPFDKILITAAAPRVPEKLLQQLKPGGYLVIPLDEGDLQRMIRIQKNQDGSLNTEKFDLFSFVPMLEGRQDKQY